MRFITIDFETFWSSKDYTLSKMGPVEYIRDPRFHAQMLGVRINHGPVNVYDCNVIPDVLRDLNLEDKSTWTIAHNGNGFDFLVLSEVFGVHPANMFDTIVGMRWIGLSRVIPESHAELTKLFETGVKEAGTVISDGKNWPDDFTPEERAAFATYCANDVKQCSENFFKMYPQLSERAMQFCSITAKMATEPIFVFDKDILTEYLNELDAATEKARQDLMHLFRFNSTDDMLKAIRSASSFSKMLTVLGAPTPMKWSDKQEKEIPALAKSDIEFLDMLDYPDERVQLLVRTRLEQNTSIQRTRTERFIGLAGKPVPIMLGAFKADTSRYTAGSSHEGSKSDGMNFQNISKRDPKQATLRKGIRAPKGYKVVACDSSQVEARLLAYIAMQTDLVQQFRNGLDPYAELAAKFGSGYTSKDIHDGAKSGDKHCKHMRNIGKLCILSAGYGVGAKKFSDTLWKTGTHLSNDKLKHDEMAAQYHGIYRSSNNNIVYFWDRCMDVIKAMEMGASGHFGGPNDCVFYYDGSDVVSYTDIAAAYVNLPTGYRLWYPGLSWEEDENGKVQYVYDRKRGKNIVKTKMYGGRLAENLIQSLAFQMLAWQACNIQAAGIQLRGNVHDSWFAVVPESDAEWVAAKMLECMSTVPSWLPGFPVAAEVEVGDDYSVC